MYTIHSIYPMYPIYHNNPNLLPARICFSNAGGVAHVQPRLKDKNRNLLPLNSTRHWDLLIRLVCIARATRAVHMQYVSTYVKQNYRYTTNHIIT